MEPAHACFALQAPLPVVAHVIAQISNPVSVEEKMVPMRMSYWQAGLSFLQIDRQSALDLHLV